MKPVNEDRFVKLGQESESSEQFPIKMHAGSNSILTQAFTSTAALLQFPQLQ